MGNAFNKSKELNLQEPQHISLVDLFNLQSDFRYFMCIVDCRTVNEFNASHIDMALSLTSLDYELISNFQSIVFYGSEPDHILRYLQKDEINNHIKSHQMRLILTDIYNSYKDRYSYMCTDHISYLEGRLFPSQIDDIIYLCNYGVASSKDILTILQITHVINCTVDCPFAKDIQENNDISNSISYVQNIENLRIPIVDDRDQNIFQYFADVEQFIDKAIANTNGKCKILVHCKHGQSRSPTVVATYLMTKKGMTVEESIAYMKKCRPRVAPNDGFVTQLLNYSQEIEKRPKNNN